MPLYQFSALVLSLACVQAVCSTVYADPVYRYETTGFEKTTDLDENWSEARRHVAQPDEYFCGYRYNVKRKHRADVVYSDITDRGLHARVSIHRGTNSGFITVEYVLRYVKKSSIAPNSKLMCESDNFIMRPSQTRSPRAPGLGPPGHTYCQGGRLYCGVPPSGVWCGFCHGL